MEKTIYKKKYAINVFKQYRPEERYLFLLYLVCFVPSVYILLQGINARIGLSFLNPYIKIIIPFISVLFGIKVFVKRIEIWDYVSIVAVGAFCFWSPQIYPDTKMAIAIFAPYFVFSCLPFYFVGRTIKYRYEEILGIICRIGIIVNSLIYFFARSGIITHVGEMAEENMTFAYATLPSVVLVLMSAFRFHNLLDVFLSIIGVILILGLGTRGPVLALFFFSVGYFFLFKRFKNPILSRVLLTFLFCILYLLSDTLIQMVADITATIGGSSRVFNIFFEGNVIDTSSRDWIYERVMDEITSNKSKIGYGFFYDRTILGMENGSYSHNLFLEILLDFGLYIGSFLLLLFCGSVLYVMRSTRNSSFCVFYFALFCSCVVQLFFSSSYLKSPNFWMFIGITVTAMLEGKLSNSSRIL